MIAIAILLLFGVLLVWLVRVWHERRRVTKEWKERAASEAGLTTPEDHPSENVP